MTPERRSSGVQRHSERNGRTMQGCRDLRLRPALRLHPAGRENCRVTPAASPVADASCLEHQRVLKQTSNGSSRKGRRPARSQVMGISVFCCDALHDEERQRGPIPFFGGSD